MLQPFRLRAHHRRKCRGGVDNAEVITADVEASNGIIHVIDTVILPQ